MAYAGSPEAKYSFKSAKHNNIYFKANAKHNNIHFKASAAMLLTWTSVVEQ